MALQTLMWLLIPACIPSGYLCPCSCRRYFTCALKHAQGLAEQVKITANRSKAGCVEMQEQVEMMLLDVFLEGLFEMDLRRVNSEEVNELELLRVCLGVLSRMSAAVGYSSSMPSASSVVVASGISSEANASSTSLCGNQSTSRGHTSLVAAVASVRGGCMLCFGIALS